MTEINETQTLNVEQSAEPGVKKPYETPELKVHGRVDQITQFLLALSGPGPTSTHHHH